MFLHITNPFRVTSYTLTGYEKSKELNGLIASFWVMLAKYNNLKPSRCSRLVYWECALHVGGSMSKWESEWEWALGMDRPGGRRRLREALLLLLLPTMDNG